MSGGLLASISGTEENPKTLNTYCSILTPASSVLLNTFHLADNLFSLTQSWHRQLPTRNGLAKILRTAPSWQNAKRKIWTSALLPFSFQHSPFCSLLETSIGLRKSRMELGCDYSNRRWNFKRKRSVNSLAAPPNFWFSQSSTLFDMMTFSMVRVYESFGSGGLRHRRNNAYINSLSSDNLSRSLHSCSPSRHHFWNCS